ncbi:MAG: hypothetical protein P4L46_06950 [Fimbriimonas sp.]|nr:hypothetical protein [Fimbriimonas sp.]
MSGTIRLSLATVFLAMGIAQANVNHRFYVLDQSSFGEKKGFYLDFENSAPDGQTCPVTSITPYLGVADGKTWRFITTPVSFQIGQPIHVVATIDSKGASLNVNGHSIESEGAFLPASPATTAGSVPSWANGPSAYRFSLKSISITVSGVAQIVPLPSNALDPVLQLFEDPLPVVTTIPIDASQVVRIEADVLLDAPLDWHKSKPLIDRFGQVTVAKFAGKIQNPTALKKAFAADDHQLASWKPRKDVDGYGGQLGVWWSEKPLGYYHLVKRNGFWWLMTPKGHPVFYTGICTSPALQWDSTPVDGRKDLFAELPPKSGLKPSMWTHDVWGSDKQDYVTLHGLNLIRRFGAAHYDSKAREECKKRLAAWGFSGQGKWSQALPYTPLLPVIGCPDVPKLDRHIDPFDAKIRRRFKDSLTKQIGGDVKNPFILGYSYGNEYDEIITPGEIKNIVASTSGSPAKAALIDYAITKLYSGSESALRKAWSAPEAGELDTAVLKPNDPDIEQLRRFYAKTYYAMLYAAFKSVDPNHLYFGFWIVPDWWVNDEDWNLIAPNVDVIGFDRYSDWPGIEKLLARYDKPVLLGEFSFPSWYGGERGFGRYGIYTSSDRESGRRYASLLSDAVHCPQCVGTLWFQYRDEPITGRGPGSGGALVQGEHYAFGLIDASDLPKYDLVRQVRAANLTANSSRIKLTK